MGGLHSAPVRLTLLSVSFSDVSLMLCTNSVTISRPAPSTTLL